MAKRSFADEVKREVKSDVKRSVKRGAKKAVKNTFGSDNGGGAKKNKKRNVALKIIPYVMVVFAVILAIFFVMVHIADSSAGFLGDAVQYFFGGLFGGAAVLLPLALGYYGVKWCIYNIKWKESYMNVGSDRYDDYKKARRRLVLQGVMSFLVILVIAALFGTLAGFDMTDGFDIGEMWTEGAESLLLGGGGIFGSGLAALLVGAITFIPTLIILFCLLTVFGLLMFGLTPDYVLTKLQGVFERGREARLARQEEEREREEAERMEVERLAKQQKANVGVSAADGSSTLTVRLNNEEGRSRKGVKEMSSDDILDVVEGKDGEPVGRTNERNDMDLVDELIGGMSDGKGVKNDNVGKDGDDRSEGGDFGGEIGFDTDGLDPIDEIIGKMDRSTGEVIDIDLEEIKDKGKDKEDESLDINLSEMDKNDIQSDIAEVIPDEADEEEEESESPTPYVFPPIDMLGKNKNTVDSNYNEEIQANARLLVSTLNSFKISIKDINCSRGPTITRYELRPEAGIRVRSIANLVDDIALSLATSGVRIEAPIPGKAAVGIEVPNKNRATVYLRDLIENPQFAEAKSRLTACLGMDVGGNPVYFDISKMPHMLIAGATGMGKSVCINCIIISLLYKARPEDVKLILIDPKKVEFNIYKDIPHLYAPIVSDPKKAAGALASAVAEMERRFELIEEVGVRDITAYNSVTENDPYKEHMPHMVIIIDELADLMMTAPDEVETAICRLAQKARAAGIHIIIGTQRPSVDVITGLIKANVPSRIACTVASQVDSRTIIDIAGAEKLIGRGDMLFAPVGAAKPMRVQGAFVTDSEVENIATFLRENNTKARYNAEFINRLEEEAAKCGVKKGASSGASDSVSLGGDDGCDSKFQAAVKLAVEEGKISTSLMQRKLGVGYGRAAKIIDAMEELGYVSKQDGNKPRRILLTAEEYAERVTNGTLGGADIE